MLLGRMLIFIDICHYVCRMYASMYINKVLLKKKNDVSIAHGLQSYIILWIILLLSYAFFTSALKNRIRYYHCER